MMQTHAIAREHIDITEMLVTLYVFLAQSLDRCLHEAVRAESPEQELLANLAAIKAQMMDILTVNPVVKAKVEEECRRVLSLARACVTDGPGNTVAMESVRTERAILKDKTMALSDLLAVFRAT